MPDIRFTIDVNTDGDAFRDIDETDSIRRAFQDAENAIFHSESFGRGVDAESILFDKNGNRCGRVRLEFLPEPEPVKTRACLENMTPARWESLTDSQRAALRSDSGLTPQLIGLEGYRVEVETLYGETRRFLVGRSTGWRPCHIELSRVTARGGSAAEKEYKTVRALYRQR